MDDCIANTGQAKFVTKFDLLKGFWKIPLTNRAKEISAFVTPDGLYQYKVMHFGMKNSPATFQRLINMKITGLDNCKAYIDDAIIYSEEWDQQIKTIREFFERLSKAKLTINLAKSEFCHATLTFLGTARCWSRTGKTCRGLSESYLRFSCTYVQKTADAISWYGWLLQKVL